MSIQLNQSERLTAINIDAEALEILREIRPVIAEHIDAAVSAAFAHLMRFPEVQKVYAGTDMEAAKRAQRQHWLDDVFATTFTEAQLAHSVQIGEARQRGGLALRWFFVFWSVVFARLTEATAVAYRKKPHRLPKVLAALGKVVLFDLEIFTEVYVDAASGAAAGQLNRQADVSGCRRWRAAAALPAAAWRR